MQKYTIIDDENFQEFILDDFNELQQLTFYQKSETENVVSATEFDEIDDDNEIFSSIIIVIDVSTSDFMLSSFRRNFIFTFLNESESVFHKRHDTIFFKFMLIMNL